MSTLDEEELKGGEGNHGEGGEGGERDVDVKEVLEEEEQEEKRKDRPRWPPRQEGVIPDIEWAMKSRIRTAATKLMEDFSLTGDNYERQIMNAIAKGMSREGLKVLRKKRRLILGSLGRGSGFYREEDRFEEGDSEDEGGSGTREETSGSDQGDIFADTGEEATNSAGVGGEWAEECGVGRCEGSDERKDDMELEEVTFSSGFMARSLKEGYEGEEHFLEELENLSREEEIPEEEVLQESKTESTVYPEGTEERCTFGQNPSVFEDEEQYRDYANEMGKEEYSTSFRCGVSGTKTSSDSSGTWHREYSSSSSGWKKPQKRRISWITLVCSGESRREELGYLSGWTEQQDDELSKFGREAAEEAGAGLRERGSKFDTVLTSNLAIDRETTNLLLFAVGQDSLRRYTAWELNPRHLGDLEGGTEAGTASRCGWMSAEVWAHLGPPPMKDTHPDWYRQARGDRQTGESLLQLQARTKGVWEFATRLIRKGKRSILMVCRKDVICSLLLHSLGLQPTDMYSWSPSSAVPVLLVFEQRGPDLGLAAVDFATRDTRSQAVGLYKAMLERYVDYGILDKYSVAEMKRRHEQGSKIPTIQDIYRYKRSEAHRLFEQRAGEEGERDLLLERLAGFWGERTSAANRLYRRILGKDT